MTDFEISLRHIYDFLDDIESLPRHIVMFYEEPELAKMVAFRFLKNGLERGDLCSYNIPIDEQEEEKEEKVHGGFVNNNNNGNNHRTEEEDVIEHEMQDYGIDTLYYKDKGLLLIYSQREYEKITDLDSYKKSANDLHNTLLRQYGSDSSNKFPTLRWIGRSHINIKTDDGMVLQLALEKYIQNDPLARRMYNHITTICTYKVDSILEVLDRQESWIRELLQNHDAVIFLPRGGNGLVLNII